MRRVSTVMLSAMRWVLCAGLALCAAGCFSSGPKDPESHARFQGIVAAVDALRAAYEQRDLGAFKALRAPPEGEDRLELDVQTDFAAYAVIDLAMAIERIYVQEELATVNVRWEGEWRRTPEAAPVTDRGHGALVWSGREQVLLAEVEGNLPFGIAGRGAVSAPGL